MRWTSSDAAVASVDANGGVRGLQAGSATVTATAGGKSASVVVTVTGGDAPVLESIVISGVGVSGGELSLKAGAVVQLSVRVSPAGADPGVVSWSSLDGSVAAVDGTGRVTAKAAGVTLIEASARGRHDTVLLTVQAGSGPSDASFRDVPVSHPFFEGIEWAASAGVASGNNGMFYPSGELTRAEMAAFLYRLSVSEGNAATASYRPSAADYRRFKDVDASHWAAQAILWAASVGITSGDGAGGFSPDRVCSRAEMAAFLQRFAAGHGDAAASSFVPSAADYRRFKDVGEGHWAANGVLWAASAGITSGDGAGGFSPDKPVNREQTAAFLYRMHNHLNK